VFGKAITSRIDSAPVIRSPSGRGRRRFPRAEGSVLEGVEQEATSYGPRLPKAERLEDQGLDLLAVDRMLPRRSLSRSGQIVSAGRTCQDRIRSSGCR